MPTKWYINLSREYWTANNRRVQVKYAGNPIHLIAKRRGMFLGGHDNSVTWTVTHPPDAHDDYVAPNSIRFQHDQSDETREHEFHNQLTLPWVSGRVYTVTASRTDRDNDRTLQKDFEIWQRVYYSIHFMNNRCERLFNRIKGRISGIFAEANIELKQYSSRKTRKEVLDHNYERIRWDRKEEADTEAVFPATLSHLYENEDPSLERNPAHLRVVVVNDLVDRPPKHLHWTMDQTTNVGPPRIRRVAWDGPNNRVKLTNVVAVLANVNFVQAMTATVHGAAVAVPNACKARTSHHVATIDLTADIAVQNAQQALAAGRPIALRGSLRGRRCQAGYVAVNLVHQFTLTANDSEQQPVTNGHARAWTSLNGMVAYIEDARAILDAGNYVAAATATILDGAGNPVVQIPANRIGQDNQQRIQINAAGVDAIYNGISAGHAIRYDITLRGLRAQGEIEDEADFEFEWEEASQNSNGTKRKVGIAIDGQGDTITLTANWLALSPLNFVNLEVEDFGVAIAIPVGAFNRVSDSELTIDLTADLSLQPVLNAMTGGRSVTFDGDLRGQESYGGFSPRMNRWFVALSAKQIEDQNDAAIARRMLLTFCHEVGHALGLTNPTWRDHANANDVDNPNWYNDDFGGQGPHCHHNAVLVPSGPAHGHVSTPSGEIWDHDGNNDLCIMYCAVSSGCGLQFCPNCLASLQRHRVSF